MIKTIIKIRVNEEQSAKIQQICFDNGIYWSEGKNKIQLLSMPFLYVHESGVIKGGESVYSFDRDKFEEVDADLFIETNGTCIKESQEEKIANYERKIDNLHKTINKLRDRDKMQKVEITNLHKKRKNSITFKELDERLLDRDNEIARLRVINSYLESKVLKVVSTDSLKQTKGLI